MPPQPIDVLVLDDEPILLTTVLQILSMSGYSAHGESSAEAVLNDGRSYEPRVIICDIHLPGMNGIEAALTFGRLWPSSRTILISGEPASYELLDKAAACGHRFEVFAKPVAPRDLLARLKGLLTTPTAAATLA
jgi:DNA-binding response OmpR family regulator